MAKKNNSVDWAIYVDGKVKLVSMPSEKDTLHYDLLKLSNAIHAFVTALKKEIRRHYEYAKKIERMAYGNYK